MRGNAARASLATAQGDTSFSSRFAAREEQNKSTLAGRRARENRDRAKRASFSRSFFADGPETRTNNPSFQGSRTRVRPVPATRRKILLNPEKSQSIFFLVSFFLVS
jgi:hypothetical protein